MTQVLPAPVSQITFDKPKRSKDPLATNPTQQRPSIQPPQVIGRDTLLNALHKVYPLAAVFTVVPGFQTTQRVTLSADPLIPKLLTSLYDAKYCRMSVEELKAAVESLQLCISDDEARFLETATKGQSSSCLWFDHRVGRITTSVMGKVVMCAERKFPTSLVNSIMQYQTINPNIPALRWGRQNEDKAKNNYYRDMVRTHGDFEMHTAGILISTKYPFLGATPDGVVSCDCCGSGLLEVKCPYKYRDINPSDIADVNFYLQAQPDGTRVLNQTHEYYYQVQGQMAIWNKEYCDFVCWTSKGHVVTRIQYDKEFFEGFVGKCKHFFDTYILPELMTRRLQFSSCSQKSTEEEKIVYCYCGMPEEPDNPMIACDAPDCPIEWFHFSCVGISEEPESDEEWFCDECIERLNNNQ